MTQIGITEILFLMVLAILLFGGDLPEIARKAGRYMGKIQQYFRNLQQQAGVDARRETSPFGGDENRRTPSDRDPEGGDRTESSESRSRSDDSPASSDTTI